MVDRTSFGFETNVADVVDGIDLTGKCILITGGSAGLGAKAAEVFAEKGADIVVTGRDLEKGSRVTQTIQATTGVKVEIEALDLASVGSIRKFAEKINDRGRGFDIVLNNAGIMACPFQKTEDGFEMQFGVNHLGHFLMTNLIADRINDGARVVSYSSHGHHASPVVFEDIMFEERPYDNWLSYGQSKTATALFAVGLQKRLASRGVDSFSVHPGAITTELVRHLQPADFAFLKDAAKKGMRPKTLDQGVSTGVYAAAAPELKGKGGVFLADCQIAPFGTDPYEFHTVNPYAQDDENAEKLWAVSEKYLGQQFSY